MHDQEMLLDKVQQRHRERRDMLRWMLVELAALV